jgi:hypothetical protein
MHIRLLDSLRPPLQGCLDDEPPPHGPSCSRCNGPQDHRSINRRLWSDQCVRQAGPAISAFQRAFHGKDKDLAGINTT